MHFLRCNVVEIYANTSLDHFFIILFGKHHGTYYKYYTIICLWKKHNIFISYLLSAAQLSKQLYSCSVLQTKPSTCLSASCSGKLSAVAAKHFITSILSFCPAAVLASTCKARQVSRSFASRRLLQVLKASFIPPGVNSLS